MTNDFLILWGLVLVMAAASQWARSIGVWDR